MGNYYIKQVSEKYYTVHDAKTDAVVWVESTAEKCAKAISSGQIDEVRAMCNKYC